MERPQSAMKVLGPIIGAIIVIYLVNLAFDRVGSDYSELNEETKEEIEAAAIEREAEAIHSGEAISETVPTTDTTALTETVTTTTTDVAARVFFLQPTTNAQLPVTSTVVMGFEGVSVEPSGEVKDGSGHMHILVDTDFVEPGEVIVNDALHLHYGDGSITAEINLAPGSHTLRLQFADGAHVALEGDQYRDEIVVNVSEDAPAESVHFAFPSDGATVPPEFTAIMAATGVSVEPSGEVKDGSGHMHILVDTDFVEPGEVIINDELHLHFGDGSTTAEVNLSPGSHTLRLQFADGAHIALEGEQYRDEITITVEE